MNQITTLRAVHTPAVPAKVFSVQKFGSDTQPETLPAEVAIPEKSGSNPLSGFLCGAATYYLATKLTESRFLQIGAGMAGYFLGSSLLTLENLKSILPVKGAEAIPAESTADSPSSDSASSQTAGS